jgi:hypothetical protein
VESFEHGRPSHIILVCNDITERRRAERLLVEQEKLALVGQLATSIAHEINNPLEAVLNLLYLIRESESLDEAHGFAAQVEEEIQRAAQIASNTLKFHKQQTRPASTNVQQLVESVLVLFKGKLAAAKVAVEVEPRGKPELICFARRDQAGACEPDWERIGGNAVGWKIASDGAAVYRLATGRIGCAYHGCGYRFRHEARKREGEFTIRFLQRKERRGPV